MILWTASFSSNLFSVFSNPCTVFAKQTKSDENIAFHLVRITENTWSENKSEKRAACIICMDNEWRTRILKIHCSRVIYANIYVWISWATFGDWFLAWDFSTHAHSGLFIHTAENLRRCSKFILSKTDLSYF